MDSKGIRMVSMMSRKPPVLILAGGLGSRLGDITQNIPKPMIELAGVPILVRIMESYAAQGFAEFVVLAGYKADVIKSYFANITNHQPNITFDLSSGFSTTPSGYPVAIPRGWNVTILDSGIETETGGRLLHATKFLESHEVFFLTYGDALCDVDFEAELKFHLSHGRIGTVLGVNPPSKFGLLEVDGTLVKSFSEKRKNPGELISGGFFIFNSGILAMIEGPHTVLEENPLRQLANASELEVYRHQGFWHCMDTPRELASLQAIVKSW